MSRAMDDDRPVRKTHSEPLPASVEKVVAMFKRVLQLPNVQEIRVTPNTFEVTRLLEPTETSVMPEPESIQDIDFDFLLSNLRVLEEVSFSPDNHPYIDLVKATQKINSQKLVVSAMAAPTPEVLCAFFGLDDDPTLTHVLGIPVIFHRDSRYPMKLVILGGSTNYISDASTGVIIDMGV